MRKPILAILFFLSCLIYASSATAQVTTVYLVRHAEKDMADPNIKDPGLNGLGLQRATDLDKLMSDKNLAEVFSTNTRRTLMTAMPLTNRLKKSAVIYDPSETKLLANKIQKNYKGKTILVVGHSNTLLPLIKALGGYPSINEIKDDDYRNLFKLIINGADVKTEELKYGN
jgi:broad specificity phosphatase PhoE